MEGTMMAATKEREYPFPVFTTQGGGLVEEVASGVYRFVEAPPSGMGLGVGDYMPREWGIVAANRAAVEEILDEQFGDGDYER